MSDTNGSSRHGACDRCRGQKLRCVGSARPILNLTSRFMRNATPCDRCRRAKVECYSVRPAPRRAQTATLTRTPPSSEGSLSSYASRASSIFSQPPSTATDVSAPKAHQEESLPPSGNRRNGRFSTFQPPTPSEWMTYIDEEKVGIDEGPGGPTQPLINELSANLRQDPEPVNVRNHIHNAMFNLPYQLEDWNPDHIHTDIYPGFTMEPPPSPALAKIRKTTSLEGASHPRPEPQSGRSYSYAPHTTPTRPFTHDLAELHEALLRANCRREYTLTGLPDEPEPSPNQHPVGQTLQHCQRLVSILKRIRYFHAQEDSRTVDNGIHAPGQVFSANSNNQSMTTDRAITSPAVELPTLFSILFCYTSILAAYEDIFLSIIEAVKQPMPTVPPTLSGLRIDDFGLDGHNALQLECLLNVSYVLLEKAEGLLFGSVRGQRGATGGSGNGVIQDKLAEGLVDVLFEAEDQDKNGFADGFGGGKSQVRVKRLIREIQAALNEIDL